MAAEDPCVGRQKVLVSVHARVSYSRPNLILNQLEKEAMKWSRDKVSVCLNQQALIHLCDYSSFFCGEKYLINAKWLNFKYFVLCFVREMKIQICDTFVG